MATLIGLFAAVVLILAVVGLYGVMAYVATQRTTENGNHARHGRAQPASIVAPVMWRGVRLLAIGVATGLTGLIGTRYTSRPSCSA
jgi:hypothetical protein